MDTKKIRNLIWYLERPKYWPHVAASLMRSLRTKHDTDEEREEALCWAASKTIPQFDALNSLGLISPPSKVPELDRKLIKEARARAQSVPVEMGGPGDIELIFSVTLLSGSKRIIETGVAFGWSSLAILAAIETRPDAKLISVDMPYPNRDNEPYVGVVVPKRLRRKWEVIRKPDRTGLKAAITEFEANIDMCHYDSDKTYWGRKFAYHLLWNALKKGGIFLSDDIEDNLAFREFVETERPVYAVTECHGKFVGIARKP